jgi:predicted nucleic acid-binding protein
VALVDTSVWVELFRDTTGKVRRALLGAVSGDDIVLSRFHQLELLQGARDEHEWELLSDYLGAQEYLELNPATWSDAARIFFELRRAGRTVRSPIDCCIAQLALDYDVLLIHRDRDFETISRIRPLRHLRLRW